MVASMTLWDDRRRPHTRLHFSMLTPKKSPNGVSLMRNLWCPMASQARPRSGRGPSLGINALVYALNQTKAKAVFRAVRNFMGGGGQGVK